MLTRDLPILFNAEMVRAILDGRKTQTRRPVKLREFGPSNTPGYDWTFRDRKARWHDHSSDRLLAKIAPYRVGDRLYVRETWSQEQTVIYFRADEERLLPPGEKWRPSVHMPKAVARIWLDVVGVRVERARDISDADARVEGMYPDYCDHVRASCEEISCISRSHGPHVHAFRDIWIEIYGRAAWDAWVWAYDFRRIEVPR